VAIPWGRQPRVKLPASVALRPPRIIVPPETWARSDRRVFFSYLSRQPHWPSSCAIRLRGVDKYRSSPCLPYGVRVPALCSAVPGRRARPERAHGVSHSQMQLAGRSRRAQWLCGPCRSAPRHPTAARGPPLPRAWSPRPPKRARVCPFAGGVGRGRGHWPNRRCPPCDAAPASPASAALRSSRRAWRPRPPERDCVGRRRIYGWPGGSAPRR
jgi:hypothetical protein